MCLNYAHSKTSCDLDKEPSHVVVDCIDVHLEMLISSLKYHIRLWIVEYGKMFHEYVRGEMNRLKTKIDTKAKELTTNPQDLDNLRAILQVRT